MRIADCSPKERERIDEIKRERKYADDHVLIREALTALTGGNKHSLLSSETVDVDERDRPVRQIIELWNNTTTAPIPQVSRLTDSLRKKIRKRIDDYDGKMALFEMAFKEIQLTEWCRGQGNRPWIIELRWVMHSEDRMQKFIDLAVTRTRTSVSRPANCRHNPPCRDASTCTDKLLRGEK